VNRLLAGSLQEPGQLDVGVVDPEAETEIRAQACAAGIELPLDLRSTCFGLTDLDKRALIAIVGIELDRAYERIFAYIYRSLGAVSCSTNSRR
jgi:Winged helix domain, variant